MGRTRVFVERRDVDEARIKSMALASMLATTALFDLAGCDNAPLETRACSVAEVRGKPVLTAEVRNRTQKTIGIARLRVDTHGLRGNEGPLDTAYILTGSIPPGDWVVRTGVDEDGLDAMTWREWHLGAASQCVASHIVFDDRSDWTESIPL